MRPFRPTDVPFTMQIEDASQANAMMATLAQLADEVRFLADMSATLDDPQLSANIDGMAASFRHLLDDLILLPGIMDGVEPWKPGRDS